MKMTKNKSPQKNNLKKTAIYKPVLLIVASVAMFLLVPQVFQIASDSLTPDCTTRAESGPCGVNYGYKVIGAAASISVIWAVGAIILFIRGIGAWIKLDK